MKTFVAIASILLLLALLGMTEGLQCYECEYMEGGAPSLGLKSDKSCKSGKKPKDDFIVTCPPAYGEILSCGKEVGADGGKKGTVRGCYTNPSKREGCIDVSVSSKLVTTLPSGNATTLELKTFSGKAASVTQCLCSGDKCNSANVGTSSVTMLVLSVALLFKV